MACLFMASHFIHGCHPCKTCISSMRHMDVTYFVCHRCKSGPANGSALFLFFYGKDLYRHRKAFFIGLVENKFYTNSKECFTFFSEFTAQGRGVLREALYNVKFNMNRVATMREHPVFKTPPQNQMVLRDFDAPVDVADYYVQRLTSYLQVNLRPTIKRWS